MRRLTLRGLFLTAAVTLILLPLLTLAIGLVGVAALNWASIMTASEQVDQIQEQAARYAAQHWELAGQDPAAFAEGLAAWAPGYRVAAAIYDVTGAERFASPGVYQGQYQPGGLSVSPTTRAIVVRDSDQTLGFMQLWITPAEALNRFGRAISTGLWAGAATLLVIMLLVLRSIRRMIQQPLHRLQAATEAVAAGRFDFEAPRSPVQELDALALGFGSMRDRLQAALARQEALESERRQFIAAVGHDLRTPLSSVRAYAEGLRDGLAREPARAREYGQVILTKTRELERLVEDLFEYGRLGLPGTALQLKDVDGAAFLQSLVQGFDAEAEAKGIRLQAEGESLSLCIDPDLFARPISNLLANALRHTPAGGQITVGWGLRGGRPTIRVLDTGEGISADDLPHLFTPLHRTDRSRSRASGGAGLGLAIAARIVWMHAGEIRCTSQPGEGACFEIQLPAQA